METIVNILSSFDIFQILATVFSMVAEPVTASLQHTFTILFEYFRKLFLDHPGISFAMIVFIIGYITVSIAEKAKRYFIPVRKTVKSL